MILNDLLVLWLFGNCLKDNLNTPESFPCNQVVLFQLSRLLVLEDIYRRVLAPNSLNTSYIHSRRWMYVLVFERVLCKNEPNLRNFFNRGVCKLAGCHP